MKVYHVKLTPEERAQIARVAR